jgi:cold shock CspA family protein
VRQLALKNRGGLHRVLAGAMASETITSAFFKQWSFILRCNGTIQKWFGAKRYGFLTEDTSGNSIFFHANKFKRIVGEDAELIGRRVSFEIRPDVKNPERTAAFAASGTWWSGDAG